MKELFGKGITKSIVNSLVISLALCAVLIGVHASLGIRAIKPLIDNVELCETDKEKCVWNQSEWIENPDENAWNDYDILKENYPTGHQATAMYANKVSNLSSMVWFNFYRIMVVVFAILGVVMGIIFDLIYRKKSIKKK